MENCTNTINDRVKMVRKYFEMTQINLAEKLHLTHAQISAIELGKSVVTDRNIELICAPDRLHDDFTVNENWLRTGDGEMFLPFIQPNHVAIFDFSGRLLPIDEGELITVYRKLTSPNKVTAKKQIDALLEGQESLGKKAGISAHSVPKKPEAIFTHDPAPAYKTKIEIHKPQKQRDGIIFASDNIVYLPFYGKTAAGKPIDIEIIPDRVVPYMREKIKGDPEQYFFVEVVGDSMVEADIKDGDYVLIKRAEAPKQNRIMLVRHGDESTIKRIKINGDQEVYMSWEDGSRETKLLDQDYEIQGEFKALLRG